MGRPSTTKTLDPYLPRLFKCIKKGFHDYRKYMPKEIIADNSGCTRASFIRDRIICHAKKEFSGDRSTRFQRKGNGLVALIISNPEHYAVRFKKFNNRKCTSNIPTQQALAFQTQCSHLPWQRPLFDVPCTHLNVGYVPDDAWTDAQVFIAEPNGVRSNAWVMEIPEDRGFHPVIDIAVDIPQRPRRIRVKPGSQKKKGANNEGTNG